ncbi:MAG: alpha/beta hydrolase [Burkholderiales bacterium]|nr:alpha/beta hydrolase [Burkholderiales bacterium]
MRIRTTLYAAALVLLALHAPASADPTRVTTARGTQVDVVADFPSGVGPFPTVVLAPGQGYHMGLPAMEQTAKQLVGHGVAVYRFNWAYFSRDPKGGQPSEDLSQELQDLQTVLTLARADARVAAGRIAVGGKSLGSLVAWQALRQDAALRGGLFLTPVCSRVLDGQSSPTPQADENYPGITTEQRPLLFVSGDSDPLCAPPILLPFAARAGARSHVAIVGGDHSFGNRGLSGPAFETSRDRNVHLVALLGASFITESLGL